MTNNTDYGLVPMSANKSSDLDASELPRYKVGDLLWDTVGDEVVQIVDITDETYSCKAEELGFHWERESAEEYLVPMTKLVHLFKCPEIPLESLLTQNEGED